MVRIVGIGGGTGLSVLLRGFNALTESDDADAPPLPVSVTAVVCVSDNGGSSGHLRQSLGIPAVGDLRNCLVALSDGRSILPDLFQYRFPSGDNLHGHSVGNLIMSALWLMSGGLGPAVERASELLGVKGCVLPVTERPVTLCAALNSGSIVRGEVEIVAAREYIRRIWLEPESPPPTAGVLDAIASADAIVLGPGSLYTSILPNLLVAGVPEAIRNSPALKIFVGNLMTQPGESDRFTASDHLRVVETYLGPGVLDICALNSRSIEPALGDAYRESGSEPVWSDLEEISQVGIAAATSDLLEMGRDRVRHDPVKLARKILSLICETNWVRETCYASSAMVA